jgi:hypothetical protein
MSRRITVEFERGGSFVARLLDEEAPTTCAAVWDALPIQGEVKRSAFSGLVMFVSTDVSVTEPENAKVYGLCPGDMSFFINVHRLALDHQINWVFGPAAMRDVGGDTLMNHFARIVEGDLDELAQIGDRVWTQGVENVVIRRA